MASGSLLRRPAVLLALGLCGVGGVVTLLGHLATGPQVEQKRVAFTAEAGAQAYPAFSPDGQRIAYSARGVASDDPFHVFVRSVAGGTTLQVTTGENSDIAPVWSPDGKSLAFARLDEGSVEAMLIPAHGGVERKIAEFPAPGGQAEEGALPAPVLSWLPDGKSLAVTTGGEGQPSAIALLDIASGQLHRITKPPEGSEGDSNPVASPDGASIAFIRTLDPDHVDIYVCDTHGGAVRQFTFDGRTIRGMAWTPGAHDLVYASDRGIGWRLWRLPAYGGSSRDLEMQGRRILYPAVAPAGSRLAYMESPAASEVWRAATGSPDEDASERPVLRSSGREMDPSYSPDGKLIADVSEQNGSQEIWITGPDSRTQITRMEDARIRQPQWSPDGKTLLFECHSPRGVEVYETPAGAAGKAVVVLTDAYDPSWSHDGKSIYYESQGALWKADADGKNPRQLTRRRGGSSPRESSDGQFVYYRSRRSIWRVPADGGKEEEVFIPEHDIFSSSMQAAGSGLYYTEMDRARRGVTLAFYDFASGKSRPVLRTKGYDLGGGFSVSPDGASVLYSKVDNSETHLVLVENFR